MNDILIWLEVLLQSPIQLAEGGKAGSAHPHYEMLILHILPLNVLPIPHAHILRYVLNVPEFVLNIRVPRNVLTANWDVIIVIEGVLFVNGEGVVEHALGDEAARNCWPFWIHFRTPALFLRSNTLLLVIPQILHSYNGVAIELDVAGTVIISVQLVVVS